MQSVHQDGSVVLHTRSDKYGKVRRVIGRLCTGHPSISQRVNVFVLIITLVLLQRCQFREYASRLAS